MHGSNGPGSSSGRVVFLGVVSCAIYGVGSWAFAYAIEHAMTGHWTTFTIFLLLMGLYVLAIGGFLSVSFVRSRVQKRRQGSPQTLAFRLMIEQCEFLLKGYRNLLASDPDHSKRPLSHQDSWPLLESNSTWTYTQLRLWLLASDYRWLVESAKASFAEMGWTEQVPFFRESPVYMVELLPVLEKFERTLESKIALLEAT